MVYKSLGELVDVSLQEVIGEIPEFECKFTLVIDGTKYKAYSAACANREISLYTDKAVISYMIDDYGCGPVIILYDVIEDQGVL